MIKFRFLLLLSILVFNSNFSTVFAEESLLEFNEGSIGNLHSFNNEELSIYATVINQNSFSNDSIQIFRWKAIDYAQKADVKNASIFIEKYIKSSLHVGFVNNDVFEKISDSEEFKELQSKYSVNFSVINIFYLFTSLIGFFIFSVLILKNKKNHASTILISLIVLMHSIFILDLFFFLTNLRYSYPHTYLLSITFSLLYGPLIYFYYKKIALNSKFRIIDLLHLIPTAIITISVFQYYFIPGEEKLRIMLDVSSLSLERIQGLTIIFKFASLLIYAILIARIYLLKVKKDNKISIEKYNWLKGIAYLVSSYVVFYCIYGLIVASDSIPRIEFLFHLQIIAMALMVLYVGYKAYLTPKLFSQGFLEEVKNKYKKSGLTSGFSNDLKDKLIYLFEVEKVYRQNNISLEILSQKLDTNRHNTSQVINEHFDLNFFELINKYRIEEALAIIKNDTHKNMNIIDIAYEVGFNNKVTFNKSFKKLLSQTPSQYIASLSA